MPLINTLFNLFVNNKKGEGRRAYYLSSPEKRGGGGLIEDLRDFFIHDFELHPVYYKNFEVPY